jgi:branched-chain amino acid transport system substrate-binding protein
MRRTIAVCCAAIALTACTEGDVGGSATTTPRTDADVTDTSASAKPSTTDATSGSATATTLPSPATTVPSDGSVVSEFAGLDWAFGTLGTNGTQADDTLEPIVIGMINQENSPVGSFPELRRAVEAAVAWMNAEFDGVNGRPVHLETCITSFSVEQSQACAQQLVQAGAVAVINGIDISANGSIPVLEQNGIPVISAIPTTLAEMRSTGAFSFSGGITGAYVAFVADAHARGASSIAIAYGQFESFEVPATEYAAKVAEQLGMDVTLVPFPITTTDFLPVVQAVLDADADAVAFGVADTACVPVITTLHDLGSTGSRYFVGACAAAPILDRIDDAVQAEVVFNSEGPIDAGADGDLYLAVTDRYADDEAGGAGTVSFRAAMNLWHLLTALDDPTPAALMDELRGSVDAPSFWGHPFTCDGRQVPGLPALCAPQQTLFRLPDDSGTVEPVTDDWIDVPALVAFLG